MSRRIFLMSALVSAVLGWWVGADRPAPATHRVELNGHVFTLPEGFTIELAACAPLVNRPITLDLDEEGRLYAADSSGSNDKVDIQLKQKPHRIVRLEDPDGDGKFDRSVVFADQMMFPEGTLWHQGSLYVAAPPSIWKLTDTDGDGQADQRHEWFQGKTMTGCANDLHGPYLGPDGWVYWCKGGFARQTHERPGKAPFVTRAAHVFRSRPNGADVEPVMIGGMDNPVDVTFTSGGERFITTTFFQRPGGGKRDGLIHIVYGGIYGKDHEPIYEHKWTAPTLMPVLSHMGPAAPCGLTCYASRVFGPEFQGNLFACQFNMHKVSRHILEPDGASFKSRDEDFLVSNNLDFHPTDVVEDADGSLLVVDTGGWYKLCCPTSQLVKPDVLGAIYRVKKKDAPRLDDPRGRKLLWGKLTPQELTGLLDDPRPAVRQRALEALAAGGAATLPVLQEVLQTSKSTEARRNAVWSACRIDHASARAAVRTALGDAEESVRQAALHVTSVWRDREAVARLVPLLANASAHNRRAAAEALGRIGDKTAVPALLEALGKLTTSDRVLEHSLTFALIDIADREGTGVGLKSSNVQVRRGALVALDQMDGGGLEANEVARDLTSREAALKEVASWIVGRHPEWGTPLAGLFRDKLAARNLSAPEQLELARQLGQLARATAIQELLTEVLAQPRASTDSRLLALRAMAQSGLKEVPAPWAAGLVQVLKTPDLIREAVATARALPWGKQRPDQLIAELVRLGSAAELPAEVRLTALAAVPGGLKETPPALLDSLRAGLDGEQPVAIRSLAVDVLSRARLTTPQLLLLTEAFKAIGPMEADRLLQAFVQSTDDKVGLQLVESLKTAPVRASLPVGTLRQRLAKFGPRVQEAAAALYASLDAETEKQREKLEKLLAQLQEGDIRRGQAVFNGPKAACSSCHAIGYLGGNVGPDLTRVGQIRTPRDLLESIVFPSTSFVQGFEPMQVITKDGKVHNGLIRKNTPDEIVVAIAANQEVRVAREEVEEMHPSKVSMMPAGLDQQLTLQELADLVTFLRACK